MILSKARQIIIPLIFSQKVDNIKEMIKLTDICDSTIRTTIYELEKMGLIEFKENGEDKRVKKIKIIEDNPNIVLCKLFGYDPLNPFKGVHKKQEIT